MLGYLYRMLIGRFSTCHHKWAHKGETQIFSSDRNERPVAVKFLLQCEKCGDFKTFKVES